MKHAYAFLAFLVVLSACGKEEVPARASAPEVPVALTQLAALKTVADVEAFASSGDLPSSKQTLELMRLQAEQIPSSGSGADGRIWITLHIQNPETTAHLYFYHDPSGYVISTIIHLEPGNKP